MRYVAQKEVCGCGLACIASIVGRSYEEVQVVSEFLLEHNCENVGTTTFELHVILLAYGYSTPRRLIPFRNKFHKKKLSDLETDALLKVGEWHWCVWDAKRKRVIDPLRRPDPWIKPSHYLPVTKRDWTKKLPSK
jgi:ABC-type bacteriocin/lantibiotic exporter with double-glycine peptidase domain